MLVEKKKFSLESFHFESAKVSIPVQVGYETYGKLNREKDNVIVIEHFFTGTSHAAGRYSANDPLPGWWDSLIGPGKAIDTHNYFVICADTISNINFNNPKVITTGPASINPATGKEYGMSFPIFTLDDVVKLHKKLLDSLGIKTVKAVIGPSMGGLQAFMWAKYFPEMVPRIVSVASTPMVTPFVLMIPNQLGIDAIRIDPKWKDGNYYGGPPPFEGLLNAFKVLLMITRTDRWADSNFGRKFADPSFAEFNDPRKSFSGKYLVEREVEKTVLDRMKFFDPNSYIYIAKANTLYDIACPGETIEKTLGKMKAKVLMIIDESDLMFNRRQAQEAMKFLPSSETYYYYSGNGHLSCIYDSQYFEGALKNFLE